MYVHHRRYNISLGNGVLFGNTTGQSNIVIGQDSLVSSQTEQYGVYWIPITSFSSNHVDTSATLIVGYTSPKNECTRI